MWDVSMQSKVIFQKRALIKSILPKSSKCDSIREVKINNDVITDPLTICNTFNQYFKCIGSNLAKKNPAYRGKSP